MRRIYPLFGPSTFFMRPRCFFCRTFFLAISRAKAHSASFTATTLPGFQPAMLLAGHLDAVVRTDDPDRVLRAFFGSTRESLPAAGI